MSVYSNDSPPSSIFSPADLTHLKQLPTPHSSTPPPPSFSGLRDAYETDLAGVSSSPRLAAAFEILEKSRRKTGSSRSLKEKRSTSSLVTQTLAEEERQNNKHLKTLVRSAVDRAESEMRKAHDAEARVEAAERAARDIAHRLARTEAQGREEYDAMEDQKRRIHLELQQMRNEMMSLQELLKREEGKRRSAEESASKAKQTLRNYQAREQGKEEGKELSTKLMLTEVKKQGYEEGRKKGYEEGCDNRRDSGYEDGLRSGRKQGFREGRNQGRSEERAKAMQAFNQFLLDEMEDKSVDTRIQRTRDWAEALDQDSEEGSGGAGMHSPEMGRRGR